ncbi:MAG: hypothetical protein ACRYG6_07650 [Janthinobacterium lividum]
MSQASHAPTTPAAPPATAALPFRATRRGVGGAILAALTGAAVAGAVVLSDPGEAFPVAASPDDELISLCAECDALQVQVDALWDGVSRIEDDDERDNLQAPLTAQQIPLIERMCETRPTTLQGHVARCRTYHRWDKSPPDVNSPYCNEAMQGAILRDLAALAE